MILSTQDYNHLWQLLKSTELVNDVGLCVDCCIPALVGGMSEDRIALVRKVTYSLL